MSLLLILTKIWKYKLVTFPIFACILAGAFYVIAVTAPTYEASATYILVNPPPLPTDAQIARDPALARIKDDNPYTRFGDQSVLVQVLSSRLNSEEARLSLEKRGADPHYTAAPSAEFGFSAPILQITGTGPSAAAAIATANLVGDALTSELDKMQRAKGVDKGYRIKTEAVVPAHDAKLKPSGKLRSLVAVFVLGTILLFLSISVLDALGVLRAQWTRGRVYDEPAGDGGSFVPPVTLHRSSESFSDPAVELKQWPVEAKEVASPVVTSLSGLLPVKVSGRHYGENLARLDLLFSSLLHYAPALLDELLVVVRADETDQVGSYLDQWPELPIRMVVEDDHFPAFQRFSRPWQVRPWQRQQVIKLNAPAMTDAAFVLTLDPDVLAVKPITRDLLLPGGRALLESEPRSVHERWWRDSADLLDVEPALERRGINVTPAILATTILSELQQRLEAVGGRPWMDVLLTSYCDWTEYSLYLLAAERAGLLERHHRWAGEPAAPAHLHTDPALSIWGGEGASRADIGRLFRADDPGLFAVVQSSSGLTATEVADGVAEHIAIRRSRSVSPSEDRGRSKLEERARIAARLTAQGVYRGRRRLRRARLRATHREMGEHRARKFTRS